MMSYLDKDLIYRWNNPLHSALVGKPGEDIIGRHAREVLPESILSRAEGLYREVLTSGEPYHGRAMPLAFPGLSETVYCDFTYVPIPNETGTAQGILVIANDVTQRVENERLQTERIAQLQAADRTKDEFLSVISHELRTPLNFITGFASTLDDEVYGPLTQDQHTAVSRILNGADRMLLLVDDLLDFAKLQAGKFELSPEPTPYAALVEDAVALMQPLAQQKGIRLSAQVDVPQSPTVDGSRLTQVLTNLISNALKFTESSGEVCVVAAVRDGWLVTEVRDSGCGIAEDDIPRLFQPFQQLDMGSTRKAGGTGLGLVITEALIEAHGGTISVESKVGAGSTFRFQLPLAK